MCIMTAELQWSPYPSHGTHRIPSKPIVPGLARATRQPLMLSIAGLGLSNHASSSSDRSLAHCFGGQGIALSTAFVLMKPQHHNTCSTESGLNACNLEPGMKRSACHSCLAVGSQTSNHPRQALVVWPLVPVSICLEESTPDAPPRIQLHPAFTAYLEPGQPRLHLSFSNQPTLLTNLPRNLRVTAFCRLNGE